MSLHILMDKSCHLSLVVTTLGRVPPAPSQEASCITCPHSAGLGLSFWGPPTLRHCDWSL